MENKVYVVTSGEYSDYSIEAVFSTVGLAESYIQQNGTDFRIEEYNIDEEVVKETKLWSIEFSLKDCSLTEAKINCQNKDYQDIIRDTCKVHETLLDGMRINFFVDADLMDKAVKIASERFAAVKANEYIWLRLTRPYGLRGWTNKYEMFNIKTNTFAKNDVY